MLIALDEKNSKRDICELKNQNPWVDNRKAGDTQIITLRTNDLEIILPARIPTENFMDMLNLVRAGYGIERGDREKGLVSVNVQCEGKF